MTEVNKSHLQHEGPTDIITFDYSEADALDGELPHRLAWPPNTANGTNAPPRTRPLFHPRHPPSSGHDDHAPTIDDE